MKMHKQNLFQPTKVVFRCIANQLMIKFRTVLNQFGLLMKVTQNFIVIRSSNFLCAGIERSFSEIVNLLHNIIRTMYILFCKHYSVNGNNAVGLVHKYTIHTNNEALNGINSSENLKLCSDWLYTELNRVRISFNKFLASISSAQVLSSLQHTVFALCCHPELGGAEGDNDSFYSSESISIIIGKFFPNSTVSLDFGVWDLSFKIPFMQQSERMVEISCNKILIKVTNLIVKYSAQFGFEVSQCGVASTAANDCTFTSSKIYFLANNISQYLFNCLLKLKTEISLPVSNFSLFSSRINSYPLLLLLLRKDKLSEQASEFLFNSFQQYSLKVIGTVLVFLRKTLDAISKDSKGWNLLSKASKFVLFIGRLSWLIRFDGMLSEGFFNVNKLHTYPRRLKVSVEQLFSAFEIADADGDGKLNSSEVFEVGRFL